MKLPSHRSLRLLADTEGHKASVKSSAFWPARKKAELYNTHTTENVKFHRGQTLAPAVSRVLNVSLGCKSPSTLCFKALASPRDGSACSPLIGWAWLWACARSMLFPSAAPCFQVVSTTPGASSCPGILKCRRRAWGTLGQEYVEKCLWTDVIKDFLYFQEVLSSGNCVLPSYPGCTRG